MFEIAYSPNFARELLNHMKEGYSFESFASKIGTHNRVLWEWARIHPDFEEARLIGEDHARYQWERIGIGGAVGKIKGFNPKVWELCMKHRFEWTDKKEVHHTGAVGGNVKVQLYLPKNEEEIVEAEYVETSESLQLPGGNEVADVMLQTINCPENNQLQAEIKADLSEA